MDFSRFSMSIGEEKLPVARLSDLSPIAMTFAPVFFLAGNAAIGDAGLVTGDGGIIGGADVASSDRTRLGLAGGFTNTPDGHKSRSMALYGTHWLSPSLMAEWVLGAGFGGSDQTAGFGSVGLHWDWQPSAELRLHAQANIDYVASDEASGADAVSAAMGVDTSYRTTVGEATIEFQSRIDVESSRGQGGHGQGIDLVLSNGVRLLPEAGMEVSLAHNLEKPDGGEPVQSLYLAIKARL